MTEKLLTGTLSLNTNKQKQPRDVPDEQICRGGVGEGPALKARHYVFVGVAGLCFFFFFQSICKNV